VSNEPRFTSAYAYPYHWIPFEGRGGWRPARVLSWGLEYLVVLRAVRELVVSLEPRKVLDLGCGDGRLAHELLSAGVPEVVGVDLVDQAIVFARAFNAPHGDRARFQAIPVQDLGESDFDVAIAMETLEHIPDDVIPGIVDGLADRLAPGGRLVVSVPTTNTQMNSKDERHYTLAVLAGQLERRFTLERHRYVYRLSGRERRLRRLLTNRVWTLQHPGLVRALTSRFERAASGARERNGAHVLALFVRRDEPA